MRLFVAMDPSPQAREHLSSALAPLRGRDGAPRWADTDRWHITLAFLGEVEPDRVEPLSRGLDVVGVDTAAVTLWLGGGGTFPPRGRPQVLWVGLRGDVGQLGELSRAVRRTAAEAGVTPDRQVFRAHLTLGRWRGGDRVDRDLAMALAAYESPAWVGAELRLVHSMLGARPTYRTLHTARLDG